MKSFVFAAAAAGVALGFLTSTALGGEATLEDVKAKFGDLTRAQIEEMGYAIQPVCVDAGELPVPIREQLGVPETAAMGFHAAREELFDTTVDALEPEVVFLGPQDEVWGVEYEAADDTPSPQVLGQDMNLIPGHPGMEFPHYVLHVWFVDNPAGQFADFNPSLSCAAAVAEVEAPALPAAGSGGYLDSGSSGVLSAAWIAGIAAVGVGFLLAGWWAWRRFGRA